MTTTAYSLEHIRQEYAVCGAGDTRLPALDARMADGSRLLDLQYQSHAVTPGKPPIEGLPATYTEQDDEADTLTVTLADPLAGVTVTLFYTVFAQLPAIARHAEIACTGENPISLDRAMSLCLDLPDSDYEMVELTGAWARERHVATRPLAEGVQAVSTRCAGIPATSSTPSLRSSARTAARCTGKCTVSALFTAATSWPRPTWTPTMSPG